jgi:hypothetical protein
MVERLAQAASDEREREHRRKQRDDLLSARAKLKVALAQRASQDA